MKSCQKYRFCTLKSGFEGKKIIQTNELFFLLFFAEEVILTEGVSVVQKQQPRLHPLSISQDYSQESGDGGATACLTPARSVPDMETKSKSSHLPYQKLDSLTQKYPRQFSSRTASFASDGSQVTIFRHYLIHTYIINNFFMIFQIERL